ncbi:hypothetical protein [Leeuwenhoekiella sp. MAR_2009_132]|uniref:hypothetical protein n=1 Tax=Leeuwenhoekiella sp. MAR_2009_132 TaxID=1392489 RepID=UPI000490704F|nr:hypothetical protein [Leeuwenhoekiella sp. MAR_2009_132]
MLLKTVFTNHAMLLSKNNMLPLLGMFVLALLMLFSYINESLFLERIMVCSFILSLVCIGKIGNNKHQ